MPKFYDCITPELQEWALQQPVFWTASAPLVGKHINISPKGLPTSSFSILSPHSAAYLDYTGSGSETISHLYENGRITILFNSFGKSPRILRFFCTGRVIESDNEPEFTDFLRKMGKDRDDNDKRDKKLIEATRAVIFLDVWQVQTSCGYGVPVFVDGKFEDRETLENWCSNKIEKGELGEYQAIWNRDSLDGLMGLRSARRRNGEKWLWWGNFRAWVRRVVRMSDALGVGIGIGMMVGIGLGRLERLERLWWWWRNVT